MRNTHHALLLGAVRVVKWVNKAQSPFARLHGGYRERPSMVDGQDVLREECIEDAEQRPSSAKRDRPPAEYDPVYGVKDCR